MPGTDVEVRHAPILHTTTHCATHMQQKSHSPLGEWAYFASSPVLVRPGNHSTDSAQIAHSLVPRSLPSIDTR
jgi:hypothetical protein